MTHEATITREDENGISRDEIVEVSYIYHKASRGERDILCGVRGGAPLEPDEPSYIEITKVLGAAGSVSLDEDEENDICADILASYE